MLNKANETNSLLVTADKDFGELAFRQKLLSSGEVLVRLEGVSSGTKASIVATVVRERENELMHAFTVISAGMVRIRRNL